MANKKSFMLYLDWKQQFKLLSDEQAGILIKALLHYAETGEKLQTDDGMLIMAFSFMIAQMDRDSEKYAEICKRNAENGSKGGRPKNNPEEPKKPSGFSGNPEEPKKPDTDTGTETEKDIHTEMDTGTDTEFTKEDEDAYSAPSASVSQVVQMFLQICTSYPKIRGISKKRENAIKARLRTYGLETIQEVFRKAEASSFLKGKSSSNFSATFDWIMMDSNFCKILEGNYDDKPMNGGNANGETWDNPNMY